eukprot:CAMPEP_0170073750 /NCGR_PEP_ID=MMETSP0019_2-20121128/11139_1 /TAXON_ID=98059 /ORGANISM="Dinobryon sp., Strain UTEXLB2267" /LENGTH=522 /DNA_ID=CAMNT_0010283535 /DNA_START=351 /DNA_END=1919 /DNA_ORIENTATION=+
MVWSESKQSFQQFCCPNKTEENVVFQSFNFLRNSFLPSGDLTNDYYKYTLWRAAQRLVGATLSVFGTQALLLALGFKQSKIGLAAATTWVLKDALGKFSRIFWASKNGRKFDSDAKKWRFRSSLLYSAGNGLEILTYVMPSLFLLIAAMANALKQMAMLTSSATRNTIYKSFSTKSDNIGDITAKGEAQIAVIDIVGMAIGIAISRVIGTSRPKIVCVFLALSLLDLYCVFREIGSVVFSSLNFERAGIVLHKLFRGTDPAQGPQDAALADPRLLAELSPLQVAQSERLFLPTRQGEGLVRTWGSLQLEQAQQLQPVLALFDQFRPPGDPRSRILVVVRARLLRSWWTAFAIKSRLNPQEVVRIKQGVPVVLTPQVLLHKDASQEDLFRALLIVHRLLHDLYAASDRVTAADQASAALLLLTHRIVARRGEAPETPPPDPRAGWGLKRLSRPASEPSCSVTAEEERCCLAEVGLDPASLLSLIGAACEYEQQHGPAVLRCLEAAGWTTRRFMFGTIRARVEW